MTKKLGIYKCAVCGNIVEVLHEGQGALVCCGEAMTYMDEKTADATTEKHVPVAEKGNGGLTVKVGSVPHPMEEKHYIEWIEIVDGPKVQKVFLKPGQEPKAVFKADGSKLVMREYCNIHGLWKGEV